MKKTFTILFILMLPVLFHGCRKPLVNPNAPNALINITISLNDPRYYDLRFDGGYMYLTSDYESTSRGIIVYRLIDEFRAWDRLPPNSPNACCDSVTGDCSRLIVDVPYVIDNCNDIKYNIIDGSVFQGEGIYTLFPYRTSFNYNTQELHIYN